MKNMIVSMISGVVGAVLATFFVSPSFATTNSEKLREDIRTGACQVSVGDSHITSTWQCMQNEVMTGLYNNYLYCASVKVTCN